MNKIYFARHGQTVWNVENKICGATDIALTAKGHEQAKELGEIIKKSGYAIDEILCSPLERAYDTAKHVSEITGIPMRVEERLREQNFGKYESTARNGEEFRMAKTNFINHFGNGETMLHELKGSNKTYLLVAHNGIARAVQSYFCDMTNEEFAAFGIDNCQVLEYEFE